MLNLIPPYAPPPPPLPSMQCCSNKKHFREGEGMRKGECTITWEQGPSIPWNFTRCAVSCSLVPCGFQHYVPCLTSRWEQPSWIWFCAVWKRARVHLWSVFDRSALLPILLNKLFVDTPAFLFRECQFYLLWIGGCCLRLSILAVPSTPS